MISINHFIDTNINIFVHFDLPYKYIWIMLDFPPGQDL